MCVNWLNVQSDIDWIEKANRLIIDIVDGTAPDFTMGSSIIDTIRPKVNLGLDFIMVEEPRSILETYQPKPGDIFTIHQECSRNLHRDLIYLAVWMLGRRGFMPSNINLDTGLYSRH